MMDELKPQEKMNTYMHLMMHKNQRAKCYGFSWRLDDLRRKKMTIKGDRSEPAKDSPMIKLAFSLEQNSSE